jgi:hypothetical protein
MKQWLRIVGAVLATKRPFTSLCLLASLLAACSTVPTPSPSPQKAVTIENAGLICFKEYDALTKQLAGTFRPKGCFSSSCTSPLEQTVKAELNKSRGAIILNSKFVLLDLTVRTPGAPACTADCGGGGDIPFKFADVMTGTYTVILGDQEMGSMEVPPVFDKFEGICFGELN